MLLNKLIKFNDKHFGAIIITMNVALILSLFISEVFK